MKQIPEQNFIQRKCIECKKEEEQLHRKQVSSFIQRKESAAGVEDDNTISYKIDSSKGNGSRMDEGAKTFMQDRFGIDFTNVKIHTGNEASQLNRQLNAKAFTVGNDIYFNERQYNPSSGEGKHLLAHELTHVIQQKGQALLIQKRAGDSRCDFSADDENYHRVPPGRGAFTESQYTSWQRRHPRSEFRFENRLSDNHPFTQPPKWFWDRCFFYSGAIYGGFKDAIMEVWLSNVGNGIEYRVFSSTNPVRPSRATKPAAQPTISEADALEEAKDFVEAYEGDRDEFIVKS